MSLQFPGLKVLFQIENNLMKILLKSMELIFLKGDIVYHFDLIDSVLTSRSYDLYQSHHTGCFMLFLWSRMRILLLLNWLQHYRLIFLSCRQLHLLFADWDGLKHYKLIFFRCLLLQFCWDQKVQFILVPLVTLQ